MNRAQRMQRQAYKVGIDLDGRVVCPLHGQLGPEAEYQAGRAACGCMFRGLRDGLLTAVQSATFLPDVAESQQQRPESAAKTCVLQIGMA